MKNIKFKKLVIKNFRNLNEFEINFNDNVTEIVGENGLGKTNCLHGIIWCLFGKNIDDDKQFVISPIINGVEDNSITTIVKLIFDNGYVVERTYKDRKTSLKTGWVIDGKENLVAITQSKFSSELEENLVEENTFKTLSNINYLPNLNWKDLKALIFNLIGDVKDEEVLLRDNFDLIEEYVKKFGIEQTGKLLKDTDKELNEDIKRLETEYQTLLNTKEKYVVDNEENQVLLAKKKELEDTLTYEEKKKEEYNKKQIELLKIKSDLETCRNDINNFSVRKNFLIKTIEDYSKLYNENRQDIEQLRKRDITSIEIRINDSESALNVIDMNIKSNQEYMNKAKASGEELKAKEIKVENETCSACGQHLPEEKIQETLDKLKKEQLTKLEDLKNRYDLAKSTVELNEKKKLELLDKQKELLKQIEEIKTRTYDIVDETDKQKEIRILKESKEIEVKDFEKAIIDKENLAKQYEEQLEHFEMPYDVDLSSIRTQINEINEKLATTITLNKISQDIDKTLEDLNNKKDNKIKNKDKLQEVVKFNNLKADLLQQKVKNYFSLCQFRTKETNLNGDEVETFKIVDNENVEYKEVNSAKRILMGIDLVLGIQKAKEIYVPLIVDGVEVITKELTCTETQLIITRALAGITKLEVK